MLRLMYLVHKSATEDFVHVENLGTFGANDVSVHSYRLETPELASLS